MKIVRVVVMQHLQVHRLSVGCVCLNSTLLQSVKNMTRVHSIKAYTMCVEMSLFYYTNSFDETYECNFL